MPFMMEKDKVFDPVKISAYGSFTVSPHQHKIGNGLKKWGRIMHEFDSFRNGLLSQMNSICSHPQASFARKCPF
jgi:hypothetical protein